jgi:hypothetical protein
MKREERAMEAVSSFEHVVYAVYDISASRAVLGAFERVLGNGNG